MTKKQNSGFTLLELLVTISIIGILAASVTYGVADYVKEKRSEQHVVALWSELSTLRARAIKDDRDYFVEFSNIDGSAPLQYTIIMDNNNDDSLSTVGTNGDTVITSGFLGTSGKLTAGIPTLSSGTTLDNVAGYTPPTSNFLLDAWLTGVPKTGGTVNAYTIRFRSDEIGTISNGALFIQNTSLKNRGYAIVKAPSTHTIKLWKWNGSRWYEM